MAPLGYLEVLDARGHVAERVRLDRLPVHIGRAYSNDIILDDPYVCPWHASVFADAEGRLLCRDRDSVNGVRNGGGARVESLELHSGTEFRLGRTVLRYRAADHPIAPALPDREHRKELWKSPYAAVASGSTLFFLLCLESYLGSIERATAARVVSEPLITVSLMLVWAGLWSLAGRIVINRFYFLQHVTIACAAILAFMGLGVLSEWTEFFFPWLPALWIVGLVGTGAVLAALVYYHLGSASPMARLSRLWAALAVSLAAIGFSVVLDIAARAKFSTVMEYSGVIKPMESAWIPALAIERFIGDSGRLKNDLDALAQRAGGAKP